MENECYVYVIQEAETGHIKIGYAMDPKKRLSELQVGNPRKLKIVYQEGFQSTGDAILSEMHFHKYLRYCSLSGEWFEYQNSYHNMLRVLSECGVEKYLEMMEKTEQFNFLEDTEKGILSTISESLAISLDKKGNSEEMRIFAEELQHKVDWIKRELIARRRKTFSL